MTPIRIRDCQSGDLILDGDNTHVATITKLSSDALVTFLAIDQSPWVWPRRILEDDRSALPVVSALRSIHERRGKPIASKLLFIVRT